nr:ribonuclease H-like domain-containing protein [Tanacetum cinerariifolium]
MVNLEFCDTHNMVAYLEKPEGSEGFNQIGDFLNASHIRYALTKNLTIYVSLINQFWETTSARTLNNGEIEITATIDRKVQIVTEASVRRHLKLADSDGINSLPTTDILEQLSLMGSNIATAIICLATNRKFKFSKLIFDGMGEGSTVLVKSHHTPTGALSTSQPHFSPKLRIPIRHETEVPQPNSLSHTNVADEVASTGVDIRHGGAATTVTHLDVRQASGNIDQTPTMPYDSHLSRVNTLKSNEGSMTLQELMAFCTTLSKKVESLEKDLKQTKARIVVSDDEDGLEDSSKQGRKIAAIDQDHAISLIQHDAQTQGRYEQDMEYDTSVFNTTTVGVEISIANPEVKTASVSINDTAAETFVYIRRSDAKAKDKEAAVKLQEELDEEERQRITRVHEAARSFTEENWEDIRARVKADEEAEAKRNKPITQPQQRTYMSNYIKHMTNYKLQQLKKLSFDEIKDLFEITMTRINTFVPMETEVRRGVPELVADSSYAVVREVGVVSDLSKVANPLYTLRDKDPLKSKDPQAVVAAAKLLILNPNEFDLWKKRIEQYFLMTDYSLWEVILNGDSPTLTRVDDDKHQLKFNIHQHAKSLMEAIENRFGGNKEKKKVRRLFSNSRMKTLVAQDQLCSSISALFLQIRVIEAIRLFLAYASFMGFMVYQMDVKSAFLYGTIEEEVYVCQPPGFEDPGHPDKVKHKKDGIFISQDKYVAKILRKFRLTKGKSASTPIDTEKPLLKDPDGLESVEARLIVYQPNENVFEEDIKLLKLDVMLRDNALVELRKKFEKAEQERDDSKLNDSVPTSPVNDRYKSGEGYHAVPHPYTRTFMPPKPDLVFHDAPTANETVPNVFNVEPSTTKPTQDMMACFVCKSLNHLIKDYDFYEKQMVQKPVRNHAMRVNHQNSTRMTHPYSNKHVVPTAVLTRPVKHVVNKAHSPIRRTINHKPTPKHRNFHQKVTTVKAKKGNPQQALKDKCAIDSGCSRHMTENISYLSDFKEINRGYVAFGGNPKGGKITGKGKITTGKLDFDDVYFVKELKFNLFSVSQMCDKKNNVLFIDTECVVLSSNFKVADENHVLLRVPRENNMYNVDLKNIVPSRDLTWIKREFSVARTPQQNGVVERKNRTLIEAARNMLADLLLPILFWAETVNTACYVQNRVLVTKPYNKTPYELLLGKTPSIGFMRPFGCLVTILNTLDPLGKFDGKAGSRPKWLFDIDTLTQSMNYQPVVVGNQPNPSACIQGNFNAGKVVKEIVSAQQYVLLLLWSTGSQTPQNTDADVAFDVKENESEVHVSPSSSDKTKKHDDKAKREAKGKSHVDLSTRVKDLRDEFEEFSSNNANRVNAVSAPVTAVGPNPTNITNNFNAASPSDNVVSLNFEISGKYSFVDPSQYPDDIDMPALEDIIYSDDEEDVEEPKRVHQVLKDPSWIEAMQEELLKFKMQKGRTQEEGIYYKEVFAPVARIEAIWLFLAYASFMGFMDLCKAFEKLMNAKFQISSIGELIFFLGLQVKKKDDRIFICQDKYVAEILRKFGLTVGKLASTPINTKKPLLKDPDVKRNFRYLKGKPHLGLWYPKDSPFNLVVYSKSDYAGASLDRKSTIGDKVCGVRPKLVPLVLIEAQHHISNESPLLGVNTPRNDEDRHFITAVSSKLMQFGLTRDVVHLMLLGHKVEALIDMKKVVITEDTICQDLRLDDVDGVECLPNKEIFAELARIGYEKPPPKLTFYKAFFSAQWKFLIHTIIQSQPAPPSSPPQQQPTQTADTSESSMTLFNTLMETCATLTQKVSHLEQGGCIQTGGIAKLVANKDVTLVDVGTAVEMDADTQGRMEEDVTAVKEVNVVEPTVFDDEEVTMTMAQTLIKMKAEKARILDDQMAKRLQDEELEQAATRENKRKKI